jgi:DNA-damage-inducible protein D
MEEEQSPIIASHTSPFDKIRRIDEQGNEYWSARELAPLLGYSKSWQNFEAAINKAKVACQETGNNVTECFNDAIKTSKMPRGGVKNVKDYHLNRLACYLIAQNGDPRKKQIAAAQLYFAVQTRRQELTDQQREEDVLAGLTEDQRRLVIRNQLSESHRVLAQTAQDFAGIVTSREHANFMNSGYKGLYNGETATTIHRRKHLKSGANISDYMNPAELAANLFRSTQTEERIRTKQITNKAAANEEHYTTGRQIRNLISEGGGIMPEDQPTPTKSIQQIRREEIKRLGREQQPLLFDPDQVDRGEE